MNKQKRDQWIFYFFEVTQVILACFTFAWGAMRLWRFVRKPR